MKLNIYGKDENGKKIIIKTYEAQTYDLMFGTIEDVAEAVNLDSLKTGSNAEIIKMVGNLVTNSMGTVKELLFDIFDGLTEDEVKHTTVIEIANVIVEVVLYTIKQLNLSAQGKN